MTYSEFHFNNTTDRRLQIKSKIKMQAQQMQTFGLLIGTKNTSLNPFIHIWFKLYYDNN